MCRGRPVNKFDARIWCILFIFALIDWHSVAVAQPQHGLQIASSSPVISSQENVVTALNDRSSDSFFELITSDKRPLPRPIMQHRKGSEGRTILTIDFENLRWPHATRAFDPTMGAGSSSGKNSGLELIRVGQFQENPPICRISVTASDPEALRLLSLHATAGKLTVKWPRSLNTNATTGGTAATKTTANAQSNPPLAPPIAPTLAPAISPQRQDRIAPPPTSTGPGSPHFGSRMAPEVAANRLTMRPAPDSSTPGSLYGPGSAPAARTPNDEKKDIENKDLKPAGQQETTKRKSILGNFMSKIKRKAAEDQDASPVVESIQPSVPEPTTASRIDTQETVSRPSATINNVNQPANQDAVVGTVPKIELRRTEDGQSEIIVTAPDSSRNLAYKTFRLSAPERFVIDFENLKEIATAQIPSTSGLAGVQSLRVGNPAPEDSSSTTGRLVIDLEDPELYVIPGEIKKQPNSLLPSLSFLIGRSGSLAQGLKAPPGSTIVLDAGHGGSDPGAQRGNVNEKDLTLSIARHTQRALAKSGIKVVMTRDSDTTVTLPERVELTNNTRPDVFLSVHINALQSNNDIHGIETYYQTSQSRALASSIHESLVSGLKAPDRSVRTARFYVINRTTVPAVLAEVGFISNKEERDKLTSQDYQKKIADALCQGVVLYLKQHSSLAQKLTSQAADSQNTQTQKNLEPSGPVAEKAEVNPPKSVTSTNKSPVSSSTAKIPNKSTSKAASKSKSTTIASKKNTSKSRASQNHRRPTRASVLAGKGLGIKTR